MKGVEDTVAQKPALIDFDTMGLVEAQETGHPVIISRSLTCFPDSITIKTANQGGHVVDMWRHIRTNAPRWEITVYRQPNGNIKIDFDFPKKDCIKEENGILVDTRFATISTRRSETQPAQKEEFSSFLNYESWEDSGSTEVLPSDVITAESQPVSDINLTPEVVDDGWEVLGLDVGDWEEQIPKLGNDHVVRGIKDEEMMAYLKTGLIQSRGDVVNDLGQKTEDRAWTYFFPGPSINGSFAYAAMGIFDVPTFDHPAYVISLKRSEKIKEGSGDLYSPESLPLDDVDLIYEIRPIATSGGLSIDIFRRESQEGDVQYSLCNTNRLDFYPQMIYAFKSVSFDDVKETLSIGGDTIVADS